MEGWLQKKGTAELTNFGRKTWRKRWCVLDADTHVFSYYEGFDASAKEPTVKRGAMHVANYTVKAVDHHERNYVFMLKEGDGGTGKPVYLQADSKGQVCAPLLLHACIFAACRRAFLLSPCTALVLTALSSPLTLFLPPVSPVCSWMPGYTPSPKLLL
jgi:hypothetical protein